MNKYIYTLKMSDGSYAETTIEADNEIARDAFLKRFLIPAQNDSFFFVDNLSNGLYNKTYILGCRLKGVLNEQGVYNERG